MPKTHDAIDQARALLVALDRQLTAVSATQTAEAREQVAALSFGLTALLDQLVPCRPDNDQEAHVADADARSLVTLYEEYSGGPDRRLVVAQFAARWFVLAGFTRAPLHSFGVHGPFDRHEARREALRMHNEATGRAHWAMQQVES